MLIPFFLFVISMAILWGTERCRRDPENCKDSFMTEQGWTRSPFAIKYLGRPQEARSTIVDNKELRQRHLLFSYGLSVFFLIMSVISFISDSG